MPTPCKTRHTLNELIFWIEASFYASKSAATWAGIDLKCDAVGRVSAGLPQPGVKAGAVGCAFEWMARSLVLKIVGIHTNSPLLFKQCMPTTVTV